MSKIDFEVIPSLESKLIIVFLIFPLLFSGLQFLTAKTHAFSSEFPIVKGASSTNWISSCNALVSDSPCEITNAEQNIFMVGDSHAAMFAASVAGVSKELKMGFSFWSRSGCEYLLGVALMDKACEKHNKDVTEWIELRKPAILLVANVDSNYRPQGFLAAEDYINSQVDSAHSLLEFTKTIVILGPTMSYEPSSIIVEGKARNNIHLENKILQSKLKDSKIGYFSTLENLCPQRVCLRFENGEALYEDYDHLTFRGSDLALGVGSPFGYNRLLPYLTSFLEKDWGRNLS